MGAPSVFEFEDYKRFLRAELARRPGQGRGERSRWADALRCHPTYVSQVLNGSAHLNPEQGEALTRYLGLGEEETEYFLGLLHFARAGTPELRAHHSRKLERARERRLVLANRLRFANAIGEEARVKYYSAWYYAAIHVLSAAPSLRAPAAMAAYLGISGAKAREALEFLAGTGLVVAHPDGTYGYGEGNLHLPSDSPLVSKHHANWRVQALRSLEDGDPRDLHYSSVVSVAAKDLPRIKEEMIAAIQRIRAIVAESPEEEGFCYAFDLFGLKRR